MTVEQMKNLEKKRLQLESRKESLQRMLKMHPDEQKRKALQEIKKQLLFIENERIRFGLG